ncbi:helix-turn-helix transcriptional regulator [Kitasatospora sp. NA04385]|uniref:helix-turn-helix domain-containing protein n=1 Tax=Kitasatospora sp. NA04385 TaxID=2742135 RepID=UPI001591E6A3|nr:helix-turn-helix transcriptional regulator [Kitasatospora sp. NA04385]QKW22521.1 helix-turn-helix transcriptional regulator [Kitasatospora sp. NA04385]
MPLSPSSTAQAAREAVAKRLRDLRQDAGLTGQELAARTGWSGSKVSRISNAKTPASDDDIRQWCVACNAENQAADLVAANRAADEMYVQWRRVHHDGMRRSQEETTTLLKHTQLCRSYCSNVVPGMLQTQRYAAALLRTITDFQGTPNDVEAAVEARRERFDLLRAGGHRYSFILEETVLRYRFGDEAAMREQLEVLLSVMALPTVALGIIPNTAPRTMWPLEAFLIFDDQRVMTESLSAVVNVTAPSEVAVYDKAFRLLSAMAVYGAAARGLIGAAVQALG